MVGEWGGGDAEGTESAALFKAMSGAGCIVPGSYSHLTIGRSMDVFYNNGYQGTHTNLCTLVHFDIWP